MGTLQKTVATGEGAEHENITTEGSIAQHAFGAYELKAGKRYMFGGSVIVNDNNSTDTLLCSVRFGADAADPTANTDCATSAAVDVADSDQCAVFGWISVHSATRAVMTVFLTEPDAKGTIAAKSHTTVLTIAEGTAYYLDLTLDWSVAHADNEAAASDFWVQEVF